MPAPFDPYSKARRTLRSRLDRLDAIEQEMADNLATAGRVEAGAGDASSYYAKNVTLEAEITLLRDGNGGSLESFATVSTACFP